MKMTFNPVYPEYAEGRYDSFFLLKFFPEQWQREYFLSGKLYMRQHTEFALSELGPGRSDNIDGADLVVMTRNEKTFPDIKFFQEDGKVFIKVEEFTEKPEGYRENQTFISYPVENQRRNLCCFYTLWCNQKTSQTSTIDVANMRNFGEYGVLITDMKQLLNRIGSAVNADPTIIKASCGFVHYLESNQMRNVMVMNPFIKQAADYSYQNEFRLCADTDNTNLLELDTHVSFQDIAVPIRLEEFAKTVKYQDGYLWFKADSEIERTD